MFIDGTALVVDRANGRAGVRVQRGERVEHLKADPNAVVKQIAGPRLGQAKGRQQRRRLTSHAAETSGNAPRTRGDGPKRPKLDHAEP